MGEEVNKHRVGYKDEKDYDDYNPLADRKNIYSAMGKSCIQKSTPLAPNPPRGEVRSNQKDK